MHGYVMSETSKTRRKHFLAINATGHAATVFDREVGSHGFLTIDIAIGGNTAWVESSAPSDNKVSCWDCNGNKVRIAKDAATFVDVVDGQTITLFCDIPEILYGDMNGSVTGYPLFGRAGFPLYADMVNIFGKITIYFEDGNDLDIYGYWLEEGASSGVGWSYSRSLTGGGMYAKWNGDNVSGGPESIDVGARKSVEMTEPHVFRIHFNWYRTGDGHAGGRAHVVAEGNDGTSMDGWSEAGHNSSMHATPDDPHIDVTFDKDGNVTDVS